jgi:HEAT repeat protein
MALFPMLFSLLLACSDEPHKSPDLSKEEDRFPGLSTRIPYFMERLHSNRWQVRYCLLLGYDPSYHNTLLARDAESKRVLEMLINDENKRIASQALRSYINFFVDIDKTLFRFESYIYGISGFDFFGPLPVSKEDYDALAEGYLRILKSAKLDDHSIDRTLMLVGILGKPSDAEAVYRFLQSPHDRIAYNAAVAVIRLGDREKGIETLRRLASWDSSKEPPYMYNALQALKELQDPELETILPDALSSIDRGDGNPAQVSTFLLLTADAANKDIWNVGEPRTRPKEAGQFPELSKKIPYLMERLYSDRWKVRYCILGDLTGRDIETKRLLETLIRDESKKVAFHALVPYLNAFVDIDKTLFKPEVFFYSKPDEELSELGLLNEGRQDALIEKCIDRLKSAKLDDPGIYRFLSVVGILGEPGYAEVLYPFLESSNDFVISTAARAVVRIGDRQKGMEAFRRFAWDPSIHPYYSMTALYALQEMRDPELERIVNEILASIDQIEGLGPEWLNAFLPFAADVTRKDVWNIDESRLKGGAGTGYHTFYDSYRAKVPLDNYIVIGMRGFAPGNYLVLDMNKNQLRIYSPNKKVGWILQNKLTNSAADSIMAIFKSPEYMDLPERNMTTGADAEEIEITSVFDGKEKHIHHVRSENKTIRRIIDIYKEFTVPRGH